MQGPHLAISEITQVLALHSQPQGDNHARHLSVLVQSGIVLPLYVQDLASEWKDSLELPVSRLLCTPT